jgi:hypothetical protein
MLQHRVSVFLAVFAVLALFFLQGFFFAGSPGALTHDILPLEYRCVCSMICYTIVSPIIKVIVQCTVIIQNYYWVNYFVHCLI